MAVALKQTKHSCTSKHVINAQTLLFAELVLAVGAIPGAMSANHHRSQQHSGKRHREDESRQGSSIHRTPDPAAGLEGGEGAAPKRGRIPTGVKEDKRDTRNCCSSHHMNSGWPPQTRLHMDLWVWLIHSFMELGTGPVYTGRTTGTASGVYLLLEEKEQQVLLVTLLFTYIPL